jgi:hypothetical protein
MIMLPKCERRFSVAFQDSASQNGFIGRNAPLQSAKHLLPQLRFRETAIRVD